MHPQPRAKLHAPDSAVNRRVRRSAVVSARTGFASLTPGARETPDPTCVDLGTLRRGPLKPPTGWFERSHPSLVMRPMTKTKTKTMPRYRPGLDRKPCERRGHRLDLHADRNGLLMCLVCENVGRCPCSRESLELARDC